MQILSEHPRAKESEGAAICALISPPANCFENHSYRATVENCGADMLMSFPCAHEDLIEKSPRKACLCFTAVLQ
jgi:hypothetical protein